MAKTRILNIAPDFNFRACLQPFPNNHDQCDMDLMLKFRNFYLSVFRTRIINDDDEIQASVNRYVRNELADLETAQEKLRNIQFQADHNPKWTVRRTQGRDCHVLQLSKNKKIQLWPLPISNTATLAYNCHIAYPHGETILLPDIEAANREMASVKEDAVAATYEAITELRTIYEQHLAALQKQE